MKLMLLRVREVGVLAFRYFLPELGETKIMAIDNILHMINVML